MLGFYYRIWVDGITRINLQSEENKKNWQSTLMTGMTLSMSFNFVLIMLLVEKYIVGHNFYDLNFSFLPERISAIFSFTVLYILPCLLINYLLIFRNKRYEKLLQRYPYKYNGKLSMSYVAISLGVPMILLVGGMIYVRLINNS
jgi:hypothetical protein